MKICSVCKQDKADSEFYSKGKENRTNSSCKSCFNLYCVKRWTKIKVDAVQERGGKCFDCLQEYPHTVFEFHHLDPSTKDYEWNKLRLMSPARRNKELEKCVMLCANCHRIRHHTLSN